MRQSYLPRWIAGVDLIVDWGILNFSANIPGCSEFTDVPCNYRINQNVLFYAFVEDLRDTDELLD